MVCMYVQLDEHIFSPSESLHFWVNCVKLVKGNTGIKKALASHLTKVVLVISIHQRTGRRCTQSRTVPRNLMQLNELGEQSNFLRSWNFFFFFFKCGQVLSNVQFDTTSKFQKFVKMKSLFLITSDVFPLELSNLSNVIIHAQPNLRNEGLDFD